MDFYTLKKLLEIKQKCFLCGYYSTNALCPTCDNSLKTHKYRCKSCAIPLNSNLDYCGNCLATPTIFDNAFTLYDYDNFMAKLIINFKYNKQLAIGSFFAKKIAIFYKQLGEYDAIIPVPIHKKRLQNRGYNQVMELLKNIDKRKIDYKSCIRTKYTKKLVTMNLASRKKELKDAFIIVKPMIYKKILIVDDVLTTTSSVQELSKTIYRCYGENKPKIDILVLARAYQ